MANRLATSRSQPEVFSASMMTFLSTCCQCVGPCCVLERSSWKTFFASLNRACNSRSKSGWDSEVNFISLYIPHLPIIRPAIGRFDCDHQEIVRFFHVRKTGTERHIGWTQKNAIQRRDHERACENVADRGRRGRHPGLDGSGRDSKPGCCRSSGHWSSWTRKRQSAWSWPAGGRRAGQRSSSRCCWRERWYSLPQPGDDSKNLNDPLVLVLVSVASNSVISFFTFNFCLFTFSFGMSFLFHPPSSLRFCALL